MKSKTFIISLFAAALLFGGNILLAHASSPSIPFFGPLISCTGGAPITTPSGTVIPTCTSFCDILSTTQNVLYFAITIALFVLTPVFVFWAGFLILTAGGNEEKFKEGTKMLTWTAAGVGVILVSFLLIKTFIVLIGIPSGYIKGFDLAAPLDCKVEPYKPPVIVGPPAGTGGSTMYLCVDTNGKTLDGTSCYSDIAGCSADCKTAGYSCQVSADCEKVGGGACDAATLSAKYGTSPSIKDAQQLTTFLSCMSGKLSGFGGSVFTSEQNQPLCNYTRGNVDQCILSSTTDITKQKCAHRVNSCHYGGVSGAEGALAVDYSLSWTADKATWAQKILAAGNQCGSGFQQCEGPGGNDTSCTDPNKLGHVHISMNSCGGN